MRYRSSSLAVVTVALAVLGLGSIAAQTPEPAWTGNHSSAVHWSPTGEFVAANGTLHHLKAKKASDPGAQRLAFTSDGKRMYELFADKTLVRYDRADGKWDKKFSVTADQPDGHNLFHPGAGMAVSPVGNYVATFRRSAEFKVWDGESGKLLHTLKADPTPNNCVWAVAISPDGKHIAAGDQTRTIRLWDLATGKPTDSFEGTPARGGDNNATVVVNLLSFSPDGKHLASGTSRIDEGPSNPFRCELVVRDLAAKRNVFLVDAEDHFQFGIAYRRDGKQIATCGYDGVRFWDAATGKKKGYLPPTETIQGRRPQFTLGVAFAPDGKTVAVLHNGLRFWDVPKSK